MALDAPEAPEAPLHRAGAPGRYAGPEAPLRLDIRHLTIPWRGSITELAAEGGWTETERGLSAYLASLAPAALAAGIIIRRTGRKTGPTRRAEWEITQARGELA